MNNVQSIFSARQPQRRSAPEEPAKPAELVDEFDIAFQDVIRRSNRTPSGEFVDELTDPVELGPQASLQVKHLFWRHGLRRMPDTWGQLVGNLNYCSMLQQMSSYLTPDNTPRTREVFLSQYNQEYPGRGDMLLRLMEGDLEAVWQWHEAHDTFARNGLDELMNRN